MNADEHATTGAVLKPTLPGKADGVIGWAPLRLQCRRCALVWTASTDSELANTNLSMILSGSRFHTCQGGVFEGRRLCPSCYADVQEECVAPHRADRSGLGRFETRWVAP